MLTLLLCSFSIRPQSAVAGTPRQFTLTVTGKLFPPDAQILVDLRPRVTKKINETTLTTEIIPADYPNTKNMNVEVKSQSDPVKLYSNPFTFVVQPAPDPPFKYIGRIGEHGIFELTTREVVRLTRGATQGAWRIDAIRDDSADVTQTQYDIKRRVPMQDKGRP